MMQRPWLSRGRPATCAALGALIAAGMLLVPVTAARADVETVTVQLEDERCSACTARIANNLRRLEGVRSVEASVVDGRVTVFWRPGVPLEIARIREAVLHWRGGVRYGSADVTLVGLMQAVEPKPTETGGPGEARTGTLPAATHLLLATGTKQPFRLKGSPSGLDLSTFHPGQPYRVTGRVIKSGEGKNHEILLELEHAEPVGLRQ